jgi:hypothetical protein
MIQCKNCGAGFTNEENVSVYKDSECMGCNNGKYEEVEK